MRESGSAALRRFLAGRRPLVSSAISRTEVHRALLRSGPDAAERAADVLTRIDLVRVGDPVLRAADALLPPELRTLDAIHLATARLLGDDLGPFVTYDVRMAEAAARAGLRVVAPG